MLKMNSKKGFTLVELLAVIVVLAVIILIAMPAVMNAMEKARKNAFVLEAEEIVKIAQTAYSDAVMSGKTGNSFCVSYNYLKNNGFLEKKDNNYNGSVLITINPSGKASYKIWLSSANYHFDGISSEQISSDSGSLKIGSTTASSTCGGESVNQTLS